MYSHEYSSVVLSLSGPSCVADAITATLWTALGGIRDAQSSRVPCLEVGITTPHHALSHHATSRPERYTYKPHKVCSMPTPKYLF